MISKLLICAEKILIDRTTNLISIINYLDKIKPQSYPLVFPTLTILSIMDSGPTNPTPYDAQLQVELNGQVLFEQPVIYNFSKEILSVRNIFSLVPVIFREPGTVTIRIKKDGVDIQKTEFILFSPPATISSG